MATIPYDLVVLANQLMVQRGLLPEFSPAIFQQLTTIEAKSPVLTTPKDLRSLLWASIDNDDSKDLDQITFGEEGENGYIILWVAVADVSSTVEIGSPIDNHAYVNTTSVYTPKKVYSMLPEKLSHDLTSLNENQDRAALVIRMEVNKEGDIESSSIFQALVRNKAKLVYESVGDWLSGKGKMPDKIGEIKGLKETLLLQHQTAQRLKENRHKSGSLTLESSEARVKSYNGGQIEITLPPHNYAHQLIEELMIGANRCMAHHFSESKIPNIRRVVRTPKYWERIVEVAAEYGWTLPEEPCSKQLESFLVNQKKKNPDTFPDLSLTIIKLLGRGEYIVENDLENPVGHFSLALSDYTHSTAPNRRFPDLITQRQYIAHLQGKSPPYAYKELYRLADHCSKQEEVVSKIERQINKSAAAVLLSTEVGSYFHGIITGANEKGTWVRLFHPCVEGKVIRGFSHLKVGEKVKVQLLFVDIPNGFIDFAFIERDNPSAALEKSTPS